MNRDSYPHYQRDCGWTHPRNLQRTRPSLEDDDDCDAIIIGGGYTGIGIAAQLQMLRPNDDIRILEAETIGSGSPGRNSGFLLEHAFGATSPGMASELYQHYRRTHQTLLQNGLGDKKAQPARIFKGAATERGLKALRTLEQFLNASQQPFAPLSADAMTELTGSRYYKAGIELPGNSLLNPFDLITNLARNLPASVTLYEQSPAIRLFREQGMWRAQTPRGTLRAPKVFLANNAFASALGYGNAYSVKIFTYAGITPQLSGAIFSRYSQHGQWGLLPAHRLGSTLRSTDDNRILIRGLYGYESEGNDSVKDMLATSLFSRFPELQAYGLEDWWGGTTSLTANGAPLWGELKDGLYVSIGCNGVGIIKGTLLGQQLANYACGEPHIDVARLMDKPGWMPPEPFRRLGFQAVSAYERRMAGAER
ncbi:hypothetical protein ABA45_09875 [Marinobacter psychrophilus]|jgi:glycine/D-amino acid oxidase-like deaminating enzyme|uniref:FAD dependent oxidoreductase domain-containing protein n=1 Tax=Marinobacter psychrophilus TaxID=330734 RepID=A0A0H4I146_9GAMM|nr:FAD-binding oxidoreductase [Marinobacter psychrophilus]AKO52676.1 hypothetical protein ABA45_09875 [Marinobacter psychrophilus]